MKKYIAYIPIIGILGVSYYFVKDISSVDEVLGNYNGKWFATMLIQAISIAILIFII